MQLVPHTTPSPSAPDVPHTTPSPSLVPHTTPSPSLAPPMIPPPEVAGSQSPPPHLVPHTIFGAVVFAPHGIHVPPPESQLEVEQITPHATLSPAVVVDDPHVTSVGHAFASVLRRPPANRWLPQMTCAPHPAVDGYGTVVGAAKNRARSTAPFAFRNPAPSVNRS